MGERTGYVKPVPNWDTTDAGTACRTHVANTSVGAINNTRRVVMLLRYDNEAGKGDHKHVAGREVPYRFIDLATLQANFWNDVEAWKAGQ